MQVRLGFRLLSQDRLEHLRHTVRDFPISPSARATFDRTVDRPLDSTKCRDAEIHHRTLGWRTPCVDQLADSGIPYKWICFDLPGAQSTGLAVIRTSESHQMSKNKNGWRCHTTALLGIDRT
jgi:hypothetical protein